VPYAAPLTRGSVDSILFCPFPGRLAPYETGLHSSSRATAIYLFNNGLITARFDNRFPRCTLYFWFASSRCHNRMYVSQITQKL
jgi:hypothetical protein